MNARPAKWKSKSYLFSGQHLVQDTASRPPVNCHSYLLRAVAVIDELRGYIRPKQRMYRFSVVGFFVVSKESGLTKVRKHEVAVKPDKDILRFQVPVQDVVLMNMCESQNNVHEVEGCMGRSGHAVLIQPAAMEKVVQCATCCRLAQAVGTWAILDQSANPGAVLDVRNDAILEPFLL